MHNESQACGGARRDPASSDSGCVCEVAHSAQSLLTGVRLHVSDTPAPATGAIAVFEMSWK